MIEMREVAERLESVFGAPDTQSKFVLTTACETDLGQASILGSPEAWKESWSRMINQKLVEWGRSPSQFESDGLASISKNALSLACRFAMDSKKQHDTPPDRVIPTVDGGIAFHWEFQSPKGEIELQFNPSGSAELTGFLQGNVILYKSYSRLHSS
ncbi:MAG: hypothetical protein IPK87_11810 [Planctomycetes bacterium]|nr:hypothetical protein [Planctomycetota bacterium]